MIADTRRVVTRRELTIMPRFTARSKLLTDLGLATTERPSGSAARRHRPLTNFDLLEPGGVFANLVEHVASPTHRLHPALLAAIREPLKDKDPSDHPLDVKSQHGCTHSLSTTSAALEVARDSATG